ncbi:MAG: hypothetical protein RLZZ459_1139 [Cyanobacteriota bacterium]|jgi:hypothetical protein
MFPRHPVTVRLAALASLGVLALPAFAAPFSYDPVSFAGYANAVFKRDQKQIVVRNLGTCLREGSNREGYRCLSGELLQSDPGRQGRNFCKLDALWYVPRSRTVQYRTAGCVFRNDQQRLIEQGQRLLREGLDTLENHSP